MCSQPGRLYLFHLPAASILFEQSRYYLAIISLKLLINLCNPSSTRKTVCSCHPSGCKKDAALSSVWKLRGLSANEAALSARSLLEYNEDASRKPKSLLITKQTVSLYCAHFNKKKKLSTSAYVKRLSVKIEAVISGTQGELASGAERQPLFMALYYLVIRH